MHRNYHRRFSLSLSLQAAWVHEQDFEIYICISFLTVKGGGKRERDGEHGTTDFKTKSFGPIF